MHNVLVVSGYVPLPVSHLSPLQYRQLGDRLIKAVSPQRFRLFEQPLEECWLRQEKDLPWVPAVMPAPTERYATPEINVQSHIVQHNRTEWAMRAAREHPDIDVIVWLDYGILKQGAGTIYAIDDNCVRSFLDRVANYPFEHSMPFPGITGKRPIETHGHNWRFCGSTHIWPTKWLPTIDRAYKASLRDFIAKHHCVPLDLAIWPDVEDRLWPDKVPFKWYEVEYDNRQLVNFPEREVVT